jgi:eukaryotic-like serine/threonine-protein kinase
VTSWSSDGQLILYTIAAGTLSDIHWMSIADRKSGPFVMTPFGEGAGRFSPDGKWVAYQSNQTGINEVYVARFPPTGAKWQVSAGGGILPRWRADGKELFFVKPGAPAKVFAVPIVLGATPQIGQVVNLFDFDIGRPSPSVYDVTADGQKILANTQTGEEPPSAPLSLVQHFDRELRAALEHRD